MINYLINLLKPKKRIICGGEGAIEVIIDGKVCGIIKYRRPTSDEKLDYLFVSQKGLGTESQLKEITDSENKDKKCFEILIRDLSIPYAKKIFIGAEQFIDDKGKPIESNSADVQFCLLEKYWSHALVDMVAIAYAAEGVVKKKF